MGSQAGASGTGVIAVISLEAQDVPALSNSPLDLDGVQVTDTGGTTIEPICVNDGSATVDNCEPVWGADFSWYDPVRTSRTTSFNSSVGGGNLPINYSWDFGDGFGNVGQIVEHTYNHGISDVHDVQVSMGATNDCGIDQEDHSIEVWFFFDFDLDCDVDIVDIMRVASLWNCDLGEPCYDEYYDIEIDNDIDIVDIMQTA